MRPSKRESVLDAAERLFYEEGFHATGIDRVVAEAGVARMTLYNHFPSKEALIESVLTRRYERYLDDLREAICERGDGSAIMALARRHNEWLRTRSRNGCIVLKAIGEFEHHQVAIADLGRGLKHDLLVLVGEALELDGHERDPALAGRILMILEGANALAPVLGPEASIDHVDTMITALLGPTTQRLQ